MTSGEDGNGKGAVTGTATGGEEEGMTMTGGATDGEEGAGTGVGRAIWGLRVVEVVERIFERVTERDAEVVGRVAERTVGRSCVCLVVVRCEDDLDEADVSVELGLGCEDDLDEVDVGVELGLELGRNN